MKSCDSIIEVVPSTPTLLPKGEGVNETAVTSNMTTISPVIRYACLLTLAVFFISCPVHANAGITETEIIQLKFRTANEIKDIIKPFLKKEDAIIATGFQLIIRTSPENLQQVMEIIRRVDVQRRSLLVSIKKTSDANLDKSHLGVNAHISNIRSDLNIRTYSTKSREDNHGIQQINILEGGEAFIQSGISVPIGSRTISPGRNGPVIHDSIQYMNISSGFYVHPVLNKDRVTLHIRPRQSKLSRKGGGRIRFHEVETTISGQLGEWLEIGASYQQEKTQGSGITYQTRHRGEKETRIYVKVEELK